MTKNKTGGSLWNAKISDGDNIFDDKELQESLKKLANETPAEKKAWIDKVEDIEQQTRDKYSGKRAKPIPRVGICRICLGKITETYHMVYREPMVYGPGSGFGHWQSSGLSCEDCGIMYARLPK